MKNILFIIFSLFILSTFSQKSKVHKFVPYFRSLNVEKLAIHLTKNIVSDSEKVIAIHSWMTYNIDFDMKKWQNFNFSETTTKKTLIKKKTLDYSQLFYELCSYSNIQSLIIQGYVKDEYVDVSDKFYLDESSWNAVYINNEWRLVDVKMDAGKIVYYKRTFAGYFIYAFSLGANDRLVYKPYFKQAPTKNYVFKKGEDFKLDHFPADSIWQLINNTKSISEIEADSSYYFHKTNILSSEKLDDALTNQRLEFLKLNEEERIINHGFKSHQFNPKNNYGIANSYYLMSINNFPEIDPEAKNNSQLIEKCDSVKAWLSKTNTYCDSTTLQLLKQKNELIANNKKKKEIVSSQNKRLIESTDNSKKNLVSGIKIGLTSKLIIKANVQRNKIQTSKLVKSKKYDKTNFNRKTNVKDSIDEALKIKSLLDSINRINTEIINRYTYLNKLAETYISNLNIHTNRSIANTETTKNICNLRLLFIDDLDLPIRQLKDPLLIQKFKDDSLLIEKNDGPTILHLYSEFQLLKTNFKELNKFYETIDTEYCKFKKANNSRSKIDEKHSEQIENYKKSMSEYNIFLKSFKKKFKEISKISKNKISQINKENHLYFKEKYIELQMNSTRSAYINRRYKARLSENKLIKKNAIKLTKKVEKIRIKISK